MDLKRLKELSGIQLNEVAGDSINDIAIDLIDDMMSALPDDEQYGQKGKAFTHILKMLQGR